MSTPERAIAARKRARRRGELVRRAPLAALGALAMMATPARSWWMIALAGAFGWWARGRVRAHRSSVSEMLGQRSWAIVACLQSDYTEGEIEALRLLDARLVMAVENGDLASIEPLLDEVESLVTERDASAVVCDVRAFLLALRGDRAATRAALARGPFLADRPWGALARRILDEQSPDGSTTEAASIEAMLQDATPGMRALFAALDRRRASTAVYRQPARGAATRVAHASWMLRVAPSYVDALPAWASLTSAMDASWNHPSNASPITLATRPWRDRLRSPWALTMVSLALLQAFALAWGADFVRAPTAGRALLFLGPLVGLAVAGVWAWTARLREKNARGDRSKLIHFAPPRYVRRYEHIAVERNLWAGGVERSRHALSLVWSLGAPRDRALLLRRHAVTLAWEGLADESEAVLARLDEDFASYTHTTTARFEARLVSAVVAQDRKRAEKIAREYVDTLPVSRSIEALWKCVYAALVDRSLRDEARAQWHPRHERARWVLDLLEDERVRVDARDDPARDEATISSDSSDEVNELRR